MITIFTFFIFTGAFVAAAEYAWWAPQRRARQEIEQRLRGLRVETGVFQADMDVTLVDTYETHDPFALLDGQDAELGHIAGILFDAGEGRLDPDLDRQLEPIGSRILILHSVSLAPEWRGLRPGRAAGRNGDQEAVRRSPRRGLLPRPAQRTD